MHLDGTHILNASVQQVWDLLQDPEVLAKITPGVKTLESTGEDTYKAISEVKLGPVSGAFSGNMEVLDKVPPESFSLHIKQKSKIGNVDAKGSILLKSMNGNKTEVVFSGDAKLSGTLARTGQRVIGGVAKTMTNQFFQALEEEINASTGYVEEASTAKEGGIWQRFINWLKNLFGGSA